MLLDLVLLVILFFRDNREFLLIKKQTIQKIPSEYLPVRLAVYYDTSWQKGSTGRMNPCRGAVFSLDVVQEKSLVGFFCKNIVQYVHHTYHETYLSQNMFVM